MCKRSVSEIPYVLKYSPDRFKTREMCQKAADASLSSLKFVSNWFFTPKMFEDLNNAVSFNNDLDFNPISTGGGEGTMYRGGIFLSRTFEQPVILN